MKKTTVLNLLAYATTALTLTTAVAQLQDISPRNLASTQGTAPAISCDLLLTDMANLSDDDDFEFKGITAEGLKRVETAAADLQHTERAYNIYVEGQEAIFQNYLMTMATGQNHLFLGPPGAAKTMGIEFLLPEKLWGKQVTEWTTPFEIFGGQTEQGLREGKETINRVGGALDSEYVLIDEINNANPQLLGGLMSYLNPGERYYMVGGKKEKAKTRAVFSTGNATRPELLNSFLERQLQSGPATLNRFAFQSFVGNWRHESQQARLDEIYRRVEKLKLVQQQGSPEQRKRATEARERLQPKNIDVATIEMLGTLAFKETDLLESTVRAFVNAFREKMNKEVHKSKSDYAENPKEKTVFEPKTEWTERTRALLMKSIRYSAAIDLLRLSPKARAQLLKKPIELTPVSLWRLVNVAITTGEGISFFNLPKAEMRFNIVRVSSPSEAQARLQQLELSRMKELARDPREKQMWEDLDKEQGEFNALLTESLDSISKTNKDIAAILNPDEDDAMDFENVDFENIVYSELWRKLNATLIASEPKPAAAQTETPSEGK